MKNKLKFYLQKLEKNLIFQVLDQNVPFGIRKGYSFSGVDIYVSSVSAPAIVIGPKAYFFKGGSKFKIGKDMLLGSHEIEIFLRGNDKHSHNDVVIIPFEDNDSRDLVYDVIIKSLKRFCEKPRREEELIG